MRVCSNCNLSKTYIMKQGTEQWYHYKDGWLCKKCRCKLIDNPIIHAKWSPRRLVWTPTGKRIQLKQNARKGICSRCGKQGLTAMHHKEYHEDDPLRDTIELCIACHNKTKIGMKYKKKKVGF